MRGRSLSAEKLVMLAVAGLGGYAVYLMTRAKTTDAPIEAPSPHPLPPDVAVPGVALLGDPMTIETGRYYRGRFESGRDPSALQDLLGSYGIAANVTSDPQAAASAGVPTWALTSPTPFSRWFYGFAGATSSQPRPPDLALAWIGSPPL